MFEILSYRNCESSIRTAVATQLDAQQVKVLTGKLVSESDSMQKITNEMRKDSRFIKILTFITMLYAPTSLAAVRTSSFLCSRCVAKKPSIGG
jgi:hypothetical protein